MNIGAIRRFLPLMLGAVAALGQAPFDLPLAMVLSLCVVFYLFSQAEDPRAAAKLGFAFGFGYFAVALHWIVSPFLVDAARHGWMAPFAVALMAAGGAVFWSVAFWAARRSSSSVWMLTLCWTLIEVLRAYIFTGFPWAAPAQAVVGTAAGQLLSWIGPHGVNFVIFLGVAAAAHLSRRSWFAGAITVAPFVAAVLVGPPSVPAPLSDTVLRLVQPNAPQADKWDPEKIGIFYDRQLNFTAAPPSGDLGTPDAIIWPETAIPWTLNRSAVILEEISSAANGTPLILGAQRTQEGRYYNSLALLGPKGEVQQIYDKQHLVPFGEYVPLGNLAARFGFYGMAPQHGAGFSRGAGAQLLDLGPVGRALPLICYEAVFAHDVNAASERADFMIHATNDAWFGPAAGPQQHLAQARMRAIEQGLPIARAANTGVTAMIDPWGRITQSIAMGQAGFIDAALPLARLPTLYSRTGDRPLVLILAVMLLLGALRHVARQRTQSE